MERTPSVSSTDKSPVRTEPGRFLMGKLGPLRLKGNQKMLDPT